MSELNQDQDVVNKGRKNSLKGVDASLRDQIPKKLAKKLDDMEIGQRVSKIWEGGNSDRTTWLNRQNAYLADWDEFLEVTDNGAFTGSSNLHIPMPFIVAKTYHARMVQAIVGVDPGIKPRREDAINKASLVQNLLSYTLKEWVNERQGIDETLDNWIWVWVTTGVGLKKWSWDTKYTKFIDTEIVEEPGISEIQLNPDGSQSLVPTSRFKEVEVDRVKKLYEGPKCDYIFPEDLLMIGGKGDPQKSDVVIHRQYLTASEMWTLADRKIFDADVVEEAIGSGESLVAGSTASDTKQDKALNSGKSDVDSRFDLDRYEILEAYLSLDVDGSGINSDIVAWVHARTKKILRATYLHRINKGGMKPFIKIDFHKRPGEDMGIGLIEVLHPLSKEMDAIHNMRIDAGLLSTMPFGFYRPTSSIEPEKLELEPGILIPVDNPQTDVFFPNLGNRTTFGFQEEQALQSMVERLTGVSDLTLGVLSGTQGATRTATGTRAVQGEANANLNVHLARLVRGWKQSLEYLTHMLQQRIPEGFAFRVTGETGDDYFAQIKSSQDIEGDFDFEITADSAQSNPTVQIQNASQILQMVSNPLYIQVGTITASNIFEAQKNMLKSMGVLDWSRFIQKPADYSISLSPQEEFDRVIRGIDVPVQPQQDHQGFIDFFNFVEKSDELLGQFSTEQTIAAARQVQKHQQMMEAMKAAQAQAANASQLQTNSALAVPRQAPIGGPVEQ